MIPKLLVTRQLTFWWAECGFSQIWMFFPCWTWEVFRAGLWPGLCSRNCRADDIQIFTLYFQVASTCLSFVIWQLLSLDFGFSCLEEMLAAQHVGSCMFAFGCFVVFGFFLFYNFFLSIASKTVECFQECVWGKLLRSCWYPYQGIFLEIDTLISLGIT